MPTYVKMPVHIQAVQWTGRNYDAIIDFAGEANVVYVDHYRFILTGNRGNNVVETSDWVIKGLCGELYPCPDNIFIQSFAEVSSE